APMEPVTRALPTLLDRLKIPGDRVVERTTAPDLSFLMEGQGKTWRVTYNAQTGRVSGRAEEEPGALSARGYLLRLHLAHHYPSAIDARWFWAIGVDAMFLSMVGWGSTGFLLWWQMKNVRKVGVVVLIFSVLTAAAVAIGMHRILAG
ncbi:PepSY domain-containing protein, partial [Singulisphaera rosea]